MLRDHVPHDLCVRRDHHVLRVRHDPYLHHVHRDHHVLRARHDHHVLLL